MSHRIIISPRALAELQDAYEWLLERTPLHAPEWHSGLIEAIASLRDNPARCPMAKWVKGMPPETREFLYGNKRHAYKVFFVIRNEEVWIASIRHAARDR